MNQFRQVINWVKTRSLILAGFIKNAKFNKDGNPIVTADVNNITVTGNNRQNVPCLFPYGFFSIPRNQVNAVIINTGDSGSNPLIVGVLIGVKDLPYVPKAGESGQFSDNWLFMQQNDAIRAYKRNDKDYSATIASGEWLAKFISDLIEDNNQTMRDYINDTLNKFVNNHTHSAGTFNIPNVGAVTGVSGSPTASVDDIATNDNLTQDQDYINKQNFLLNDNAISVPE